MNPRALQILLPAVALIAGTVGGFVSVPSRPPSPANAAQASAGEPGPVAQPAAPANPAAQVLAAARSTRTLRDLARLGPLLEQLDAAQLGHVLDVLERDAHLVDFDLVLPIVKWWLARDQAAALAWLEPKVQRRFGFPTIPGNGEIPPAFRALAETAPAEIMRLAREHPDHALGGELLAVVLNGQWSERKLRENLESVLECPPGLARVDAVQALRRSHTFDAEPEEFREVLPVLAKLTDSERQLFLNGGLQQFATAYPIEALDAAAEFSLSNDFIWCDVARACFEKDPAGTVAWLEAADEAVLERHAGAIARAWFETDLPAALDWAAARGILGNDDGVSQRNNELEESGRLLNRIGAHRELPTRLQTVFSSALDHDRSGVVAWLRAQPAGPARDALVDLTIQSIAYMDDEESRRLFGGDKSTEKASWKIMELAPLLLELSPENAAHSVRRLMKNVELETQQAVAWVQSLPPGPLRTQAWIGLGEAKGYSGKKADALASLAPGPDLDAVLVGEARRNAGDLGFVKGLKLGPGGVMGSDRALEVLPQITNLELRRQTFDDVVSIALDKLHPGAVADELLASLARAEVPATWKEPWMARIKTLPSARKAEAPNAE